MYLTVWPGIETHCTYDEDTGRWLVTLLNDQPEPGDYVEASTNNMTIEGALVELASMLRAQRR